MRLDDVLKAAPKTSETQDHTVLYLYGAIEADHDAAYFRLYRDPQNRRSYLLVKKADVAGDLYEWTAEEARHAGLVGAKVYRVPLKFGVDLQKVSVSIHNIGADLLGQLDSMSEMGEMTSLRLQMMMDRLAKLTSTLSNVLKKISSTEQNVTQNLK